MATLEGLPAGLAVTVEDMQAELAHLRLDDMAVIELTQAAGQGERRWIGPDLPRRLAAEHRGEGPVMWAIKKIL